MKEFAIDLRFSDNLSGIGRDSRHFIHSLRVLFPDITELSFPISRVKKLGFPDKTWLKSQLGRSTKVNTSGIDVLFQSHLWNLELSEPTRRVIRVHDIFPLTNPEWFRRTSVRSYKHSFSLIKERDLLLADSEFTANEIIKLGLSLNVEVLNCKFPVQEDYACPGCKSCLESMLPDRYFLCVNTLEPRKNYELLLEAWTKSSYNDSNLKLLIIGRKGWKYGSILRKIRTTRNVSWIENACDGLLGRAYKNANFVINPSLAEGFNYPTLEAKVFERRCFASDIPVNKELHPDILKFNPNSINAIMESINFGFAESERNYVRLKTDTSLFHNNLKSILLKYSIL